MTDLAHRAMRAARHYAARPTALVVEPDPIVAVALVTVLEEAGFEACHAAPFDRTVQNGADLIVAREGAMPRALLPARAHHYYRRRTVDYGSIARAAVRAMETAAPFATRPYPFTAA